jgi:hypothetical protein
MADILDPEFRDCLIKKGFPCLCILALQSQIDSHSLTVLKNPSKQLHFLSPIKTKLQLICEDLGNITIRDLEQLKCTQKQEIVISVFEHSDSLILQLNKNNEKNT